MRLMFKGESGGSSIYEKREEKRREEKRREESGIGISMMTKRDHEGQISTQSS